MKTLKKKEVNLVSGGGDDSGDIYICIFSKRSPKTNSGVYPCSYSGSIPRSEYDDFVKDALCEMWENKHELYGIKWGTTIPNSSSTLIQSLADQDCILATDL